jgi:hypothetical protein
MISLIFVIGLSAIMILLSCCAPFVGGFIAFVVAVICEKRTPRKQCTYFDDWHAQAARVRLDW